VTFAWNIFVIYRGRPGDLGGVASAVAEVQPQHLGNGEFMLLHVYWIYQFLKIRAPFGFPR
jgi:hypothetical protein